MEDDQKTAEAGAVPGDADRLARLAVALPITVAATALLLVAVAAGYTPPPLDPAVLNEIAFGVDLLRPEPLERLLFLVATFSLPFVALASWLVSAPILACLDRRALPSPWPWGGAVLSALVAFGLVAAALSHERFLLRQGVAASPLALAAGIALAIAVATILRLPPETRRHRTWLRGARFVAWGVAALAIAMPVALSTMGLESLGSLEQTRHHLNAVFHAVVQVFLGQTLLVDLPHQYGLYPHFLEPIFRLTGLSLLSFSLVMAALMLVALVALLALLLEITREPLVALLGFGATVFQTYLAPRLDSALGDPYYQYAPLRLAPVAVGLWLTARWIHTRSRRLYAAGHLLSALAVLWNPDTGVVVFGAWLLTPLYRAITARDVRAAARHAALSAGSLALASGAFAALALARSGRLPDLAAFFEYQRIFYLSGFCMLPMPLWHPWMLVALVYAAGLVVSAAAIADGRESPRSAQVFNLTITGVGLFAYYQGRSHDLVFQAAIYPALLLATLLLDDLAQRARNHPGDWVARGVAVLLAGVLSFECTGLLTRAPEVLRFAAARLAPVYSAAETPMTRGARFVERHARPGLPMLLLTLDSGLHSLAARARSPIHVPGTGELFLRRDVETIARYLTSESPLVVVDDAVFAPIRLLVPILQRAYRVVAVSPDGDLIILERR